MRKLTLRGVPYPLKTDAWWLPLPDGPLIWSFPGTAVDGSVACSEGGRDKKTDAHSDR